MSESDEEIDFGNLYADEKGFYKKNKTGCSFSEYTLQLPSGQSKLLRLKHIQAHSLWGDRIYNAAILLSKLIEQRTINVQGKRILELGAATGLPSIAALHYNPELCVITDYPDKDIIESIEYNVKTCVFPEQQKHAIVKGFIWSHPVEPLLELIQQKKFDMIFCSDIIQNHSEQKHIVDICQKCLAPNGVVYVTFTHHRPHLIAKDLNFFEIAKEAGFSLNKIASEVMAPVFPEDDGDVSIRSQVNLITLNMN